MSLEERRERGANLIEQMMGPEYAAQVREGWRTDSPDFEQCVVEFLAGEIWSRSGLDLKTKSLCTISALAALGWEQGLELNIRMARANGATRKEICDTFIHLAPFIGFPAAREALGLARQLCDALGGEGRTPEKT